MDVKGITINGVWNLLNSSRSKLVPYLTGGIGYHHFTHQVSGLIWPGQLEQPLDPTLLIRPYEISRNERLAYIGGGIAYHLSKQSTIDFYVRWNSYLSLVLRSPRYWSRESVGGKVTFNLSERFALDFCTQWSHAPFIWFSALDLWGLRSVRAVSGIQVLAGFKYKVL